MVHLSYNVKIDQGYPNEIEDLRFEKDGVIIPVSHCQSSSFDGCLRKSGVGRL